MPIKFVDLLQQSWNFMRNQRSFSLFALGTLVLIQLIFLFVLPNSQAVINEQQQVEAEQILSTVMPTMVLGMINIFINILIILNIQFINQGSYQHFFQPVGKAFNALFPVLFLYFVMILPISLAISIAISAPMLIAFSVVFLAGYLFLKLCLVMYVYLLDKPQKSISETIKFTFQFSRGKMMPLVLFCVMSYFLPLLLSHYLDKLSNFLVGGSIIGILLSALVSLFITIFNFRFYQVYRQLSHNK